MKTTTFTPDSIRLEDGDIYLTSKIENLKENIYYRTTNTKPHDPVLATTNTSIPNVKHIDRSLFVKPDVDLEEMAATNADKLYNKIDIQKWVANVRGFVSGYNANKKEFTRDEVIKAMNSSAFFAVKHNIYQFEEYTRGFLDGIRPLSIPKSVICDEEYNVIQVKW